MSVDVFDVKPIFSKSGKLQFPRFTANHPVRKQTKWPIQKPTITFYITDLQTLHIAIISSRAIFLWCYWAFGFDPLFTCLVYIVYICLFPDRLTQCLYTGFDPYLAHWFLSISPWVIAISQALNCNTIMLPFHSSYPFPDIVSPLLL